MIQIGLECPVTYFKAAGEENTEAALQSALRYASEKGIKNITVATTRGDAGLRAPEIFQDFNSVVVTHMTGHKAPGTQELCKKIREKI